MWKTYAGVSAQAGGGASKAAPVSAGGAAGPGGWHPSALYMVGLVIAEIVVVGVLSRHLLK